MACRVIVSPVISAGRIADREKPVAHGLAGANHRSRAESVGNRNRDLATTDLENGVRSKFRIRAVTAAPDRAAFDLWTSRNLHVGSRATIRLKLSIRLTRIVQIAPNLPRLEKGLERGTLR